MSAWLRVALGLLFAPLLVALALVGSPRVTASPALASAVAFGGAAAVAIAALAIIGTALVPLRSALGIALLSVVALGVVAYSRASSAAALIVVDAALIAVAWGLGGSLGQRVQHAAHLFPACVVAASADVVSLLSPEGPSHAVAKSERALSVLAIWFPVPGTSDVAPALGVGDLLFVAFVLGVAATHHVSYARAVACCALGIALAGAASAWLGVAVPALVPIAIVVVLGLPGVRRLRAMDRRAAQWSMLIAVSLALATVARAALGR